MYIRCGRGFNNRRKYLKVDPLGAYKCIESYPRDFREANESESEGFKILKAKLGIVDDKNGKEII